MRSERLSSAGWLLVALIVGGTVGNVFSTPRADRVTRTERLEVVDRQGNVVATLGADDHGTTQLRLFSKGQPKVYLSASLVAGGLTLYERGVGGPMAEVAPSGFTLSDVVEAKPPALMAGRERVVLGKALLYNARTGSTETTALSSLVILDHNSNIVFRVPN